MKLRSSLWSALKGVSLSETSVPSLQVVFLDNAPPALRRLQGRVLQASEAAVMLSHNEMRGEGTQTTLTHRRSPGKIISHFQRPPEGTFVEKVWERPLWEITCYWLKFDLGRDF